jgi:hypothetical protein
MNSNDARIRCNIVSNLRSLVDLGGDSTTITDNCLANVARVSEFESPGTKVTRVRIEACP